MMKSLKRCASIQLLLLLLVGLITISAPAFAETLIVDNPVMIEEPVATTPVKPTSVALDHKGTVKLGLGDKLTLTATLAPQGAQSSLKWSSSKKKIATVSGGVVTAKKVGTTTITVTTANKKRAKVKIKVYDPYKPTSVHFDVSGMQTVMATQTLKLNPVLVPETARSTFKWKSSNKKVAVVSSKGVVTGRKPGKCTITVTTRNKKKCKIRIKVVDDGNQPITTTPDYKLPYVIYACKNSHTLAILAKDSNGAWSRVIRQFPTAMGRKNVTDVGVFFLTKKERWHKWGSGYSPYATRISVGIYLHGPIYKSKNHNTIRPTYYNVIGTDGSSGCLRTTCASAGFIYYNCPVGTQLIIAQNSRFKEPRPKKLSKKAKKDPTDPGNNFDILVTSFTLEPSQVTLTQGGTQKITPANVMPTSNTNRGQFTYVSTDKSVATVSDSGIITAVAPGACSIIVTAADDFKCAASVPVNVAAAETAGEKLTSDEANDIALEADEVISADAEAFSEATPAADTQLTDDDDAEADGEAFTEDGDFWYSPEPVEEDLSYIPVEDAVDDTAEDAND